MKTIYEDFNCLADFINYKKNNKNLKEAGLWTDKNKDSNKIYTRMVDLNN